MPDSSLSQYERDKLKPKDESWRKGPMITLADCIAGRNGVEKMRPGEIAGKAAPSAPARGGAVMGFGKYAARLIVDVQEEDPSYLAWAIREDVKGIRARAEKVGITEEDFT